MLARAAKASAATLSSRLASSIRTLQGVDYKLLDRDFSPDELFDFNKTYGSSPLNFIPDAPVREHLGKIATGETLVWGAFLDGDMVGMITGERGGGYWAETGPGSDRTCFIHEFVVKPEVRGKRIGVNLTAISVDPEMGIFGIADDVDEMYTTVHVENVASRTAFVKGGYREVMTYADAARDRSTTVLKCPRPLPMRIVGIQSGNAVDGIDVGVFDLPPPRRSTASGSDPRALLGRLDYKTVANKTFTFTPEQRQYVLDKRALAHADGNEYGVASYRMGEWMADNALALLKEADIDPQSVHLMSSHGQTISGHPHWEIGDLSVIAQRTGITTVGDFRPADVAAGGNGTPCTCTYDSIMLRPDEGETQWRVAVNIGGTSSVTFCPPRGAKDADGKEVVPHGLDPGLGVFFMDLTIAEIAPGLDLGDAWKAYDRGQLTCAATGELVGRDAGKVHEGLVDEMMEYKYYQQESLPIGVGPDDFPEELFQKWRARAQELGLSDVDLLATLTEQSAKQIALACSKFGGPNITGGNCLDVVLRGGVIYNAQWVDRLLFHMSDQLGKDFGKIRTLDELGIDEESWENAMYAMFGYLCFNGLYNFVPSCTGARYPVVGGKIAPGKNFAEITLQN